MKLSIVIVNYNVQHFLEQCLLSVENAIIGLEAEVWVVDNNSVDGSTEMVKKKFPNVKLIESKENLGFSKGNNLAISKSTGEYVLLLNPDTLVESDTFKKVVQFMDEHPDAGGLGVKMVDGQGKFLPESKRSLPTPTVAFYKIFGLSSLFPKSKRFGRYHLGHLDKEQTHEIEILSGAFMLMRKKALDEVGSLDEDFFMYGEDIDLSYRLIKGGYKNYYFADTRIIHYKGESTKKSSVNYVFVFYNAMIIFAKKHFSSKNASTFSFLIKLAIYFRASIAILNRFLQKSILPLFDLTFIALGIYGFKSIWESQIKHFEYPSELGNYIIPSFIGFTMLSVAFFGGYKKKIKLNRVFNGILFTAVSTLLVYALADESHRYSRALTGFSVLWITISVILSRLLLYFIKFGDFEIDSNARKNIGIVGEGDELLRVKDILQKSNFNTSKLIHISSGVEDQYSVGTIDQLDEIIQIHKLDEVVFCAKNVDARKIIDIMESLALKETEFKIAPPESLFILGSSSINTPGELYLIDINSLNKPENIRTKRIFDIVSSLILFVTSPILLFFVKKPMHLLKNIFKVMTGKITWVSYSKQFSLSKEYPKLKKGVLSPSDALSNQNLDDQTLENINLQYAKDYTIINDLNILIKGLKRIDQQ